MAYRNRAAAGATVVGALALVTVAVVTASCSVATSSQPGTVSAGMVSGAPVGHPFPTHVAYQAGVMPSVSQAERDATVRKRYDAWKATYLKPGCGGYIVDATDRGARGGTLSEAIGYGMNIVALMAGYDPNAAAEFNGLWKVAREHTDRQGMMRWKLVGKSCSYGDSGPPDGATDGDLDIGYGLVLADKQWGGGFGPAARDWLAKVYAADVAADGHLKCEDNGPDTDTRPSDFMLDHLRAFAAYDPGHDWTKVITRTEALITALTSTYAPKTGLLSDFVVGANTAAPAPAPADYQENQPDNIVGYNSVRVPWHLGTDALLFASPVSLRIATQESVSYHVHSGGDPARIYPHIALDGNPVNTSDQSEVAGDPVGVAAMAAGDQAFTDALWHYLATNPYSDGYYGETVKMLVYLVMAGDYWSPARV